MERFMNEDRLIVLFNGLFVTAFVVVGPALLSAGLWKLCAHLRKRFRCRVEAEAQIVDFVLSKWKKSSVRIGHGYYSRWYPVYEYEAEGRRIRRQSKVCILSRREPEKGTERLRYDPRHPERFYVPGEFTKMDWITVVMLLYVGGGFTAFLLYGVINYLTAA